MDLTALELGLRNRQLLQVKCFLKIQVETFRYFLGEDLLHIEPEERANLLEKFFHHDWQNVINKIVSVAVVNMSGDYSSMMLSISLFRSIIQSCNQLLLIVKALNESEFESLFAQPSSEQSSPNSTPILYRSYSVDSSQNESTTIKHRILNILQKQINSITSHLERIYSVNVGEIGASFQRNQSNEVSLSFERSESEIVKKFTFLNDNKIDHKLLETLMNDSQIENDEFRRIVHGIIPVLHLKNKDYSLEDVRGLIVNSFIQVISLCDISHNFAERSVILLSQTGTPIENILFEIFLTTQNSSLRQKVLLILLIHFKSIEKIESLFHRKDASFSNCVQLCSIVDLFVYCFASNEDQTKITLEGLLAASEISWSKCFIIPVLEEISSTSESLHQAWRQLKEDFFQENWPLICDHYVQLTDFSSLLTANTLWQYWIDNNEDDKLLKWISEGSIDLIFCEHINISKDFDLCQKMLLYLDQNGSFYIKNLIYEQIIQNPGFFSNYSLQELLPDCFDFQRILSIVGSTKNFMDKLHDSNSMVLDFFNDRPNDTNVSLEELIVYCLQNKFYDYLFLLFEKYAHNSVLFQRVLVNEKLSEENQNILKLLIEMNPSFKTSSTPQKDVLDQSIIVLEYISKYDHSTNTESMLEILLDCSSEPELLLMILSLSESLKFEDLKRFFQESGSKFPNLFQRFPLISKIFYDPRSKESEEADSLSIASNLSRTRSKSNTSLQQQQQQQQQQNSTFVQSQSSDIYCLLQQAIPQVDILTFFKSQIKKRKLIKKGTINLKDDNNLELLNFSQNQLSETYGLKAELTSSYYLKSGRVVEAFTKSMKNNKSYFNQDSINDKVAVKVCRKAASVVYSGLRDDKLVTSCVMFQNLVRYFGTKRKHSIRSKSNDVDKELEKTRLHVLLGKLILDHCDSITAHEVVVDLKRSHFNNRKSSSQKIVSFAVDALGRKFSNANNLPDLIKFHKLLSGNDSNSVKQLNENDTLLLLEAFEWKSLFEFVELCKLPKPMNFLRKCANHDNWFLFSIFAQMYNISKNDIQGLLRENIFNNGCIAEHLMKAFQNSSRLTTANSRLLKMKQSAQTSRNELYSKIFKEKLSQSISPGVDLRSDSDGLATSSSPETFSIGSMSVMSKALDDKNCESLVLYEDLLKPDTANKDFFQLILEIYQNCVYFGSRTPFSGYCFETTFRNTLLFASVSLSNPTFALLACSLHRSHQTPVIEIRRSSGSIRRSNSLEHNSVYELSLGSSNFRFNAFMCWLLSSANADVKDQLFTSKSTSEQLFKWSQNKSLLLIDLLSQNDPRIFSKLVQGFEVFNLEIPVLDKLLQFLVLFFNEKEYYQKDDLLLEFKRLLQDYNEDDVLHYDIDYQNMEDCSFENESPTKDSYKIFYTKLWIEKCSLILITNSLLLAKQFELAILLSHYNFARIQDSFSSLNHSIPDIQNLYFFSQCLVRLPDYNLPIRELLHDIQNVDYYQVFKSLIFRLQEENHFEEARNIINLLPKAKSNEFLINEWMLKAKQSNHFTESTFITDEDIFLDRVDLAFWENCWLQVTNLDPTMHSAYRVMERFAEHLESRKVHIKCFLFIKCLLAIETMLGSGEYDQTFKDSNETSQESIFETSYDLIHEYYQIEVQLWQSLVECEHLIGRQFTVISQHKSVADDGDKVSVSADSLEANIELVWESIWNDLTNFLRCSKLKSQLIPALSKNLYFNNDLTNRHKKTLTLDESKQEALNSIIKKLLDSFCLEKAIEVAELFCCVHEDFEIIKACEDIAKGNIADVMDLPISVQFLIQKMNKPKKDSLLFLPEYLSSEQKKAIMLIETVSELTSIGQKSCLFILLYYKIACVLQCSYVQLLEQNLTHVQVFKMLVSSYGSETPRTFYDKTDLNSSFDSRRNFDREEFDQVSLGGDNGTKISATNQYNEAILCAKELIKLVGERDEQLKDDVIIAQHLADYTHSNIVSIIEEQFKEFESFQTQTGSKSEIEIDKSLIAFNNARFLILIKILKVPSILGYFLLDICKKQSLGSDKPITDAGTDLVKRKRLIVLSELFIRAHDCFTAQCDVQGISLLLRRIRVLIVQELQPANYFQLILRLLTGIGRYSEMNYCFEIFHDKFEMILSKRVTRTPQLRIALLNYLKTTDKIDELLPLVAVRFFLFRETAEYHRSRAEKMLIELNNQYESSNHPASSTQASSSLGKFSLSSGYKRVSMTSLNEVSHSPVAPPVFGNLNLHGMLSMSEQMKTIMNEFQEAQMNFTKASSHNSADYCSRKAQLVALQIGYVNHAKTQEMISANNSALISASQVQFVLNLDTVQVRDFVNRCTNFHEALIVSRGYADVKIDWSDPFFSAVIINSNQTYAQHYSQTFPISLALLDGIMKRYDQAITTFRHSKHLSVSRRNSITNSPSSSSFTHLMGQIPNENELLRMRTNIEQLIEKIFIQQRQDSGKTSLKVATQEFSLEDKYKILSKIDSGTLLQKFTEIDVESNAYIADLKRLKML